MDPKVWWAALSQSWKEVFKREIDIEREPTPDEVLYILGLDKIDCSETSIVSLEPLSQLMNLKNLNCKNTRIKHLDKVCSETLESLNCSGTYVTSLSTLQIPNLRVFDCSKTKITSLDGIERLKKLQYLDCSNTSINSLAPLYGISTLTGLNCSDTEIRDVLTLATMNSEIDPLIHSNTSCSPHLECDRLDGHRDSSIKLINRHQLFMASALAVVELRSGSTSMIQRKFNLGYNQAGQFMHLMEEAGIVGPSFGFSPREVLCHTEAQMNDLLNKFDLSRQKFRNMFEHDIVLRNEI